MSLNAGQSLDHYAHILLTHRYPAKDDRSLTMRPLFIIAKYLLCTFGGGVLASILLIVALMLTVGTDYLLRYPGIMAIANPLAFLIGASTGVYLVHKAEKKMKNKKHKARALEAEIQALIASANEKAPQNIHHDGKPHRH